jgi:type IV pilus assembly protein PilN
MRFQINLATQPYENVRRFLLAWAAALVVALLFTGVLVYAASGSVRNAYHTRRLIAEERAKLKQLEEQERADLAILNQPQNRDVRDKSQVLNSLILRKRFSWTLIFSDLEGIMPAQLHVVSITPRLDEDQQIEVRMLVAGDSRDKAIELVKKMEESKTFRHAQVLSEAYRRPGGSEDAVQFEISALYVPARQTQGSGE